MGSLPQFRLSASFFLNRLLGEGEELQKITTTKAGSANLKLQPFLSILQTFRREPPRGGKAKANTTIPYHPIHVWLSSRPKTKSPDVQIELLDRSANGTKQKEGPGIQTSLKSFVERWTVPENDSNHGIFQPGQ